MSKVISLQEAFDETKRLRSLGEKIVLTGGCFDLIHEGHTVYLKNAKKQGVLFVLLESDENVRRLKGEGRPLNDQKERAKRLAKFSFVDYIVMLSVMTANRDYFELTKKLAPNIIAITEGDEKQKEKEEQAKLVGGKVIVVTKLLSKYSTTKLLKEE